MGTHETDFEIRNPAHYTLNPTPCTLNPDPKLRAEHGPLTLKPYTLHPKPYTQIPNCGRNTDPYLKHDPSIVDRLYEPFPHKKESGEKMFEKSHLHPTFSGFSYS
jgi:hypothetical protein